MTSYECWNILRARWIIKGTKFPISVSRCSSSCTRFLFTGYFPLAPVYCLAWICLDVLFCTASIMHLCTISVDRYLSLRYPMSFGRNKTRRRVTLKILVVWILSFALSLPLSLMYSQVNVNCKLAPAYTVQHSREKYYVIFRYQLSKYKKLWPKKVPQWLSGSVYTLHPCDSSSIPRVSKLANRLLQFSLTTP